MKPFAMFAVVQAITLIGAAVSPAIEGLTLKVECQDVVLSWPSVEGENYIIQYRPTLDPSTPWEMLTAWHPAEPDTNITVFVHSNVVQMAKCVGGQSAMMAAVGGFQLQAAEAEMAIDILPEPMAFRNDGLSEATPLKLFPPGFDLTGYTIIEPASGGLMAGTPTLTVELSSDPSGMDPGEEGPLPTGAGFPSESGFYRVVQRGVRVIGLSSGVELNGRVSFPIEAGSDVGTLVQLSVNEGGAPASVDSQAGHPFDLPLSLTIDTTQMTNGPHDLYAQATWHLTNSEIPYIQAQSQPVTVYVNNEISFPDWIPLFGQEYDALHFLAVSAHPEAHWYVDAFGSSSGYIGTIEGDTFDGRIEFAWNLVGPPPLFLSYSNEPFFQFVVETVFDDPQSANGGTTYSKGSSSVSPKKWKNHDIWFHDGDWVVANQLFWSDWAGGDGLDTMSDSFAMMAEGYGATIRPQRSAGHAFRINYNNGAEVANWQSFRQAIYHPWTRNLFYSGHGSSKGIGFDPANTNLFIGDTEIASVLKTVPFGATNRHAFRFVFLDGCDTANGNLAQSFGVIQKKNLPFTHYYDSGERRSSFVGWNKAPEIGYVSQVINLDHIKFIQNFQYLWTTGNGLRDALDLAKSQGTAGMNNINPEDLTVFGYRDLGPNQENGM